MSEPRDGFGFLDMLDQNGAGKQRKFDDISWYLEEKAREQGVPIHGQFELTPLCNLSCRMCYTHLTREQMKGQSLLTVDQWKSLIHDAWTAGMYIATLTGGECLTYPGFRELYLYLHSLGCEVHVLTNGVLLDEHWISFFKEHMPAGIQITLYGNDDDSYERVTGHRVFSTVRQNIDRILEAELPLGLTVTPNRYLNDSVFDTIRLAKSLSRNVVINSSLFDPREETGRAGQDADLSVDDYIRIYRMAQELDGYEVKEVPESMLPEPGVPMKESGSGSQGSKEQDGLIGTGGSEKESDLRGLRCGGGRSGFVIDWKGEMIPCNELEQVRAFPLRDGFTKAWQTINEVCSNWPRVRECEDCPYVSVCRTCAAGMLRYAQPGVRPAALCRETRKLVKCGVWRIAECE